MNKILFSHSYFLRFDPKQWETGQPYAPLGTLYATAWMRENGYPVSFFDTMFAHTPEDLLPILQKEQPSFFVIYDDGFNYLTKMCLTNMRQAAFQMIALARQEGCTVIVCSSDATDHFEDYLDAGADFILMGEGENTLLELINRISAGGQDFFSIAGSAFKQDNAVVKTASRQVIRDLDALPFPAWDLIDMEPYRQSWLKHAGYFSMNIGTTRGCPFKCNWCAKPIYGNRYNSRSPRNVVEELKLLKQTFSFDHIWFCDDIFGLKPGWVAEFAHLVKQEDLRLRFRIQSRADLLVQDAYVEALAKAGCENVWMGAESGSQKILDAMDKGIRVEQIYEATRLLKEHGIRPSLFIQFGYLGETNEDISKTIRMIKELMPHEIGISVSYPLPGTLFYDKVKAQLKEKSNWTDSDELQLMFHNTYPPPFYKKLHRYVHHEFRKQQGWTAWKKIYDRPFSLQWNDFKKIARAFLYVPKTIWEQQQLKRYVNE